MSFFLHSDTKYFVRKRKKALLYTLVPTYSAAGLSVIFVLLNLHLPGFEKMIIPLFIVLGIICFICILLSLIIVLNYDEKIKLNSKYSFIDVFFQGIVISVFCYKFKQYGNNYIQRDLYFVKHEDIIGIKGKNRLKILGEIKKYHQNSDRLGYHIRRGELIFDSWWLNENGYTVVKEVNLPELFGDIAKTKKHLRSAQKRRSKMLIYRQKLRMKQQQTPPIPDFFRRKRIIPTGSFNRKWGSG